MSVRPINQVYTHLISVILNRKILFYGWMNKRIFHLIPKKMFLVKNIKYLYNFRQTKLSGNTK